MRALNVFLFWFDYGYSLRFTSFTFVYYVLIVHMRGCSVLGCPNTNNNQPGLRYYEFPKNTKIRSVWNQFCRPSNASRRVICQEHFSDESWTTRDVLLNIPLNKRRLKADAIPVKNVPDQLEQSYRRKRALIRERKRLVSEAIFEHEEAERKAQDEEFPSLTIPFDEEHSC